MIGNCSLLGLYVRRRSSALSDHKNRNLSSQELLEDDLKKVFFVQKLKICLVRSSLEMISRKTINFAKTYSLLVYCRRIVEGG